MNPIISIPKEKTISYEDIIHAPLWVLGDIKKKIKDPIEELIKILKESKDTIFCIQTPRLTHGGLIQALQKAASQNVRIYLLVNEYTPELQSLRGEVLIRQGVTHLRKRAISLQVVSPKHIIPPNNLALLLSHIR